jgi:CYTH domain-containing protein
MATEIEYEKTFLLKSLPSGIENARSVLIRDVFVPDIARHPHLRLRQKDNTYVITKKYPVAGSDPSMQYEHTIELERDEFDALVNCSKKGFVKRRYFMNLAGRPAEIDIYHELLEGLAIVDFEFDNELGKNKFETPDFVLADVTQEEALAGGFLAGKSFNDIMPLLEKYGYKALFLSEKQQQGDKT